MKKVKQSIAMLLFAVIMCSAVSASAQESLSVDYDNAEKEDSIEIVKINDEEIGVPVYASCPADSGETKAVVETGTVYFRVVRLQPNESKCTIDVRYVANSPKYAASSISYSSMKVGSGLDFDKYGAFGQNIHHFRRATTDSFILNIATVWIPVDVDRVAVRTVNLQAYLPADNVWSLPKLGGQWVSVTP
mgnify:FL=1